MVTTDDQQLAERMRRFRNHGIDADHRQRSATGTWNYQICELGFNYRLSDLHCSLGMSQLRKLPGGLLRRQEIATEYDRYFVQLDGVEPLHLKGEVSHGYHLYVVKILDGDRDRIFSRLRKIGIGVNVHYLPVYLHEFYKHEFAAREGLCLVSERVFSTILSLPIFPGMTEDDVQTVIDALGENLSV